YFINKITDQVVEMQPNGLTVYLGDYDYYVEKKQEEKERAKLLDTETIVETTNDKKLSFKEEKALQSEERRKKREIAKIEEMIAELEEQLATLEIEMTKPEIFQNHEKSLALAGQTEEIEQEITQLMETWTALH